MKNDLASERRLPGSEPRFVLDRRAVLLGLVALVALYILGSWAYHRFLESDEAKIRKVLDACAQAARDHSPAGITDQFDKTFRIGTGPISADIDTIHGAMVHLLMVMYRGPVEVAYVPENFPVVVASNGTTATAEFQLRARGKPDAQSEFDDFNQRFLSSQTFFRCHLRKTDEGWKIYLVEIFAADPSEVQTEE